MFMPRRNLIFGRGMAAGTRACYRKLFLAGTALAGAASFPSLAQAQAVWGGGTTFTTDYNLGTNWNGGAPTTAGSAGQFQNLGSSVVVVTAPISVQSLAFLNNAHSYSLSGSSITLGFGGNISSSSPNDVAISNNIAGIAGSIQQNGSGKLTLSGNNTYDAGTAVTAGILSVSSDSNLGATSGNLVFLGPQAGSPGGVLEISANGFSSARDVALGGQGIIRVDTGTSTFSGNFYDYAAAGVLVKEGVGTLVLSGVSSYTSTTTVNAGTLLVNGSIATSSMTTVNAGGALGGSGTVGNTTIASGGTFAPGNGTPSSTMNVTGSLVFQSGAVYMVQINPATSSHANVTGSATLNGTVNATFAAGSYIAKQYTILSTTVGRTGTFGAVTTTNAPSGFNSTLSYDSKNTYINLALSFAVPGGVNGNQAAVGNALTNYFNANSGIPGVYGSLTAAGLSQAAGESASGSQQSTFNAMNQFMGVMTDPFVAGRGDPVSTGGGATGYADEQTLAYAAKRNPNGALAAIYRKAPVAADPFAQRWNVWAAGYGGSQTTSGNAAQGSSNTSSNLYGTAVGADYLISPDTLAGFALAGGGTNFSVANGLGSGRSDLFQAGAFVRHNIGAAYLSGALAYGWQDITTNRTVTIAGLDQLQAKFNANAWSGRVEGGYRFVAQGIGLMPYVAGQFTTFDLPAYAEQAISGANTFALAYGAKSVTATRSELGLRTDKSFAMEDGVFTLRGRAAWAHDYNADRAIGATFQTLPGASFVVNGARQASDAALLTASAEKKWLNGWSAAGTFEGEFSSVTTSYAGKGVVRYAW
jgi:autotransporter-associated beta strand protein